MRNVFKETSTSPDARRDRTLETKLSKRSVKLLQVLADLCSKERARERERGMVGDFMVLLLLHVQGYGAYLTLMMLKSTDSTFKCACAMSPVTDWKLYGESSGPDPPCPSPSGGCICVKSPSLLIHAASAFSERYLGVPLRDDSRYQVCVYLLLHLELLKAFRRYSKHSR